MMQSDKGKEAIEVGPFWPTIFEIEIVPMTR